MQLHSYMSYEPDEHRIPRFIGSCFFIGLALVGIVFASNEQMISPLFGVSAFVAYLAVSALLIVLIVSRLYRQHRIEQLRIDLANLIMLTVLISLPFALANALCEHFQVASTEQAENNKTTVFLVLTAAAGFLLLPVFYMTEALFSRYYSIFRGRR